MMTCATIASAAVVRLVHAWPGRQDNPYSRSGLPAQQADSIGVQTVGRALQRISFHKQMQLRFNQPFRKPAALVSINGMRIFLAVFQHNDDRSRIERSIQYQFPHALTASKVAGNKLLKRVLVQAVAPKVSRSRSCRCRKRHVWASYRAAREMWLRQKSVYAAIRRWRELAE